MPSDEWLEAPVRIAAEGTYSYPTGPLHITRAGLEQQREYIRSILLSEGTAHADPRTLADAIGLLHTLKIDDTVEAGRAWLVGTGRFNLAKCSPRLKATLQQGAPIAGSVANYIDVQNGEQTNMLPTHFLVHPDLTPNIPGAGVQPPRGVITFNIMSTTVGGTPMSPDMTELQAKNTALTSELQALKEQHTTTLQELEGLKADRKAGLIKKLVSAGTYKEGELKEKSLPELTAMIETIERLAGASPQTAATGNVAAPVTTAPTAPSAAWQAYRQKYKGEKA